MKRSFCVLVFVFLTAYSSFSQEKKANPFGGGDESLGSGDDNPFANKVISPRGNREDMETSDVPLDGGILVLLGAGALYGRRRFSVAKKNRVQA